MDIPYVEALPIGQPEAGAKETAATYVDDLIVHKRTVTSVVVASLDWLRHEFGLEKPGNVLSRPQNLDADSFAAAVRAVLPKKQRLSAADIQRLKEEHRQTIEPARIAAAEALQLERRLSDLVNTAYGLTPQDVQLMWDTAPPRMPFTP